MLWVFRSLGLIWNPGFEGPGGTNYNLLTNLFVAEALRVMADRAPRHGDALAAAHWRGLRGRLLAGSEANLTVVVDGGGGGGGGGAIYAQYRWRAEQLTKPQPHAAENVLICGLCRLVRGRNADLWPARPKC